MGIEILRGETLKSIKGMEVGSDAVIFETVYGRKFQLYHNQDCCESVDINEVIGNPDDLIGCFLSMAEDVSNENFDTPETDNHYDVHEWTFYKFGTLKGYVTLRWLGTSNGYYSTSVSFMEIK
jgi:hypothetical protein